MIRTINPCFLADLLSPLGGLGDDDKAVEAYRSLDPNSAAQVREVIRRELVPYFAELADKAKERARSALSYCLSFSEVNFEYVFDSCLPPFDPPDDARLFFLWLWEELFPGESYDFGDRQGVKVVADIYEPNRYGRPRRLVSVQLDSLELSTHGRLLGEIWLNLGPAFPEKQWSDFVAILLSLWLENTASLTRGPSSVQVLPFMDGPFSVRLETFDRQSANFTYLERDESVVSSGFIRLDRLLSALVSSAEMVLTECRNRGWQDRDVQDLERALAGASRLVRG